MVDREPNIESVRGETPESIKKKRRLKKQSKPEGSYVPPRDPKSGVIPGDPVVWEPPMEPKGGGLPDE